MQLYNLLIQVVIFRDIYAYINDPKIYSNISQKDKVQFHQNIVLVNQQRPIGYHSNNQADLNSNDNQEEALIKRLIAKPRYDSNQRPYGTVHIELNINMNQIVYMIETDQVIVINAFVDQKWTDNRLVWDTDTYNSNFLRIPTTDLWTPDTFMYKTADERGFLSPSQYLYAIVQNNGTVFWGTPMAKMRMRCRMTIHWFPFDEQKCDLMFGSWSHSTKFLNYTVKTEIVDLSEVVPNSEWSIIGMTGRRAETYYAAWKFENYSFSEIYYSLYVRRKPLHVIYNSVLPTLMLTTLTLVSFFIPFQQEMQMGISIMLGYSLYALSLGKMLPTQSESVPWISIYLTQCMGFSICAMVWFSYFNKLQENKRIPQFFRTILLIWRSCFVRPSKLTSRNKNKKEMSKYNRIRNSTNPSKSFSKIHAVGHPLKKIFDHTNHRMDSSDEPEDGPLNRRNQTASQYATVWLQSEGMQPDWVEYIAKNISENDLQKMNEKNELSLALPRKNRKMDKYHPSKKYIESSTVYDIRSRKSKLGSQCALNKSFDSTQDRKRSWPSIDTSVVASMGTSIPQDIDSIREDLTILNRLVFFMFLGFNISCNVIMWGIAPIIFLRYYNSTFDNISQLYQEN
ncbi:hypothetical protein SNEBB_006675 [Seison nebaliae]|nr:hypothetical protein SNEBB_006675 [Seison nebaliae]